MIDERRLYDDDDDDDDDASDVGVPTMLLFFSIYTARRGSVREPTMRLFSHHLPHTAETSECYS